MREPNNFDLEAARTFVREKKADNGLDISLVIDAVNSIGKRIEYLKYFYDLYFEVVNDGNLTLDRIGLFKDERGIVLRHKYEATAFAFLSNLHELIDSYPFLYLGIYSDKDPTNSKVGWERLTVEDDKLKTKIATLKGNHNFEILRSLGNYRKHGALPKISNQCDHLEINLNFIGPNHYKNLTELLVELHDKLIPLYFEILKQTFKP